MRDYPIPCFEKKFDCDGDWLKWREGGVGGSDVPKILNQSRFGDRLDLFLVKTGLRPPKPMDAELKNRAMYTEDRGRRVLFEKGTIKNPLRPLNIQAIKAPHYMCSLDGFNEDRVLFEHKLMGTKNVGLIRRFFDGNLKTMPIELSAIIAQITYQAILSKPSKIILGVTQYTSDAFFYFEVSKDHLFDFDFILDEVDKFQSAVNLLRSKI